MATEKSLPGGDQSVVAGADLRTKQYYCMELSPALNSQGQRAVTLVNAATDLVYGVLQNKPNSGEAARVRQGGMTKAVSNGSVTPIAVGDRVGPDATGKVVRKATDDNVVIGRAMNPSSADGVVITVDMDAPITPFRTPA